MHPGGGARIISCMSESHQDPIAVPPFAAAFDEAPSLVTVVVVGGDAVVGTTLELLLESVDYHVSFVAGPLLNEPGVLEGTDLLVLAPGLTDEQKVTVLAALRFGAHGGSPVPVVELVPELREATSADDRRLVPWPCRAEELDRQIRMALGQAPGGDRTEGE